MAKKQTAGVAFIKKEPANRPGVHSKTKASKSKTSKNYLKKYRGQGK